MAIRKGERLILGAGPHRGVALNDEKNGAVVVRQDDGAVVTWPADDARIVTRGVRTIGQPGPSSTATISMLLTEGLRPAEQHKVERLDSLIFARFSEAGIDGRVVCKGTDSDGDRTLVFSTAGKVIASVPCSVFLSAPDDEAVGMIHLAGGR